MTSRTNELVITLAYGPFTHRFPLIAVAAALRLPREHLRDTLVGLILASAPDDVALPNVWEEGREEGPEFTGPEPELHTIPIPLPSVPFTGRDGDVGEGTPRDGTAMTAEFLADLLNDHANLSVLKTLVAHTPPATLKAALDETLAVPAERIRKTRGAYFTAIVRRLSGRGASSSIND